MKDLAKEFTDLLDAKDLHYSTFDDSDGDTFVRISLKHMETTFIFSGSDGEYVSMYSPFATIPENKLPDLLIVCNSLNSQYKWLKFYLNKDNDLMIQDDAIIHEGSAGDECLELLGPVGLHRQ